MTNKINGIDVSECEKFGETIDGITCGLGKRIRFANEIITKHNLCEDNPNCYFKQLKRLQEENEKLKKKKDEYYLINLDYETKISYLIQALEEIREITEQDRNCMNSELACCRLCDKLDLIKEKTNEVLK